MLLITESLNYFSDLEEDAIAYLNTVTTTVFEIHLEKRSKIR
jgi:hypothetical protein